MTSLIWIIVHSLIIGRMVEIWVQEFRDKDPLFLTSFVITFNGVALLIAIARIFAN